MGKIPSTTGFTTSAALTIVENKIASISNLVKKINYEAQISYIESKYITAADYNKFTKDIVAKTIRKKRFFRNTDIVKLVDNADLDKKKVAALARKAELKGEKDKILKL